MGKKKKVKNKRPSKKWEKYKIESGKLVRGKTCPRCGAGHFLADHGDRYYCGSCHYLEVKDKK